MAASLVSMRDTHCDPCHVIQSAESMIEVIVPKVRHSGTFARSFSNAVG